MISKLRAHLMASETLRTSGSAGIIVATRIVGALGTLLYTVLMARMLTPQEFGIAWTLWSVAFIVSYLSTLNIGAVAIQEVVRARATGNDSTAAGFIIISRRVLCIATLPALVGFVGFIWWQYPAVLSAHPLAVYLAAATIPILGWNATNAAQATALDQVLRSHIPDMLLRPLGFVIILGAIWATGAPLDLEAVIGVYLGMAVLIAFVQYRLIRRFFTFMATAKPDISDWKRWVSAGLLLAPNRLLMDRLKDVLLLISAVPLGVIGVAKMAVALSIISFLSFAISAVETAFAPKTARNLIRNLADGVAPLKMERATHFIAISGALKMAMVGAGAIGLWLFLPLLISLYGPEYSVSAAMVWWFLLIPLSSAFFGNTTLVMQIFNERIAFFITSILALFTLSLAGIYGVPIVVANGIDPLTATAGLFSAIMAVLQAFRWMLCWWRTGIDVSFIGALLRRHRQLNAKLA
ncbi:MAG: oligosaccharide flippase family protein [Paracoccaceae bacterium]